MQGSYLCLAHGAVFSLGLGILISPAVGGNGTCWVESCSEWGAEGLAENLLVSWRKCEERAGEDESILMGARSYLGAAEANRRQRGEEWEILSEPHWAGHHFPRAGSEPASPHLRFHRSLPWSPCSHAGHRRVLAPPFPASQEGRAAAGALGHCTDLRVNDFFHL